MPVGEDYAGPVRIPTGRAKTDGFEAIFNPFRSMSSAGYKALKTKYQAMADSQRQERKQAQGEIADVGLPDSTEDSSSGPIDAKYKILKTLRRVNGQVRMFFRRKE